ncbi:MAG: DNA polymerase III subunit delta [Bacteroidales bacterium]|nr:DNA polymerase III subunit delta [Bacteroidales bacterium]
MTHTEIIENLKKKIYRPVYVLMGEEPYFIDLISDYIADNVLPESEKSFNQTILYGKDTTSDMLITIARRFPMMSAYQVVILKEAQLFDKLEDELLTYIENPLNSTILVICYKYKTLDKRKKFLKVAAEKGIVFESPKIYENQLGAWISKYIGDNGFKIAPQANAMLAEYLGTQISKVANELDKLMILLPKGATITPADVEKNIGISKEYNIFELQNALGERDIIKSNRIVNYFASNKQTPFPLVIGGLGQYFAKLLKYHFLSDKSKNNAAKALGVSPYFVDTYIKAAKYYSPKKLVEIISMLREFDMKSKGIGNVSSTEGDLLRELTYKILH